MRTTLALLLAVAASSALTASRPPELPVATFFEVPAMSDLEFSPDGSKILATIPYERRANLMVVDLEKKSRNLITNFKDKSALSPFWANDNRILFFVDDDGLGREQYKLYAVNPDGKDPTDLVPGRSMSFLRRLQDDPRHLLMQATITHRDWWDVAKFDVRTGRLSTPVVRAPGETAYYVVDHANEVRFAYVSDSATKMNRVLYRDRAGQEWTEVGSFPFDTAGWRPLEFEADNRIVYVSSDIGRNTRAIYRFDTATRQLDTEPVVADDTYDISSVVLDEFSKKVFGFTWEADRRRFHWIDPEMKTIHERIERSLPNTVHYPIQFSEDGSKIIFYSYSDRDPGVYYLYNRQSQRLEELAVISPKVDPDLMAPVKPVSYQARDGLTIHAYLTLPVGREPKNLPLIIHPHGGPYGIRDTWSFNSEVQFYANRGYAVLQINYRGSGGYGRPFEAAGFKKWGLEMQDDLTDGVRWAVEQGIADPKRIVISGASYGGYAAMAGVVYTPELYAAAINYVGVVNIEPLIPKTLGSRLMHWRHTRLGNLQNAEDRKRIYETSPVNFADRIRVPVLMAYGRNDPRVTMDQGYEIERALKRNNVPYEFIVEHDEGHGFRKEEKTIEFYSRVDTFLKKHVPAN